MSHDRGCPCGRDKGDYDDCNKPDCFRKVNSMPNTTGNVFQDRHGPLKEDNDFGFSFEGQYEDQNTMKGLLDMLEPFLKKMMTNPKQEYIKWPNRVEEVTKFRAKLYAYAGITPPTEILTR